VPASQNTRRWLALPVVVAIILGITGRAPAASADPISDKKAEAARIAKKRDELIQTAEKLNEQSKATKQKLDEVSGEVAHVEAELATKTEGLSALQGSVAQVAVKAYIYGDSGDVANLVALGNSDPSSAAAREGYASVIAGSATDKVAEFGAGGRAGSGSTAGSSAAPPGWSSPVGAAGAAGADWGRGLGAAGAGRAAGAAGAGGGAGVARAARAAASRSACALRAASA
jgi:hypothetical protein